MSATVEHLIDVRFAHVHPAGFQQADQPRIERSRRLPVRGGGLVPGELADGGRAVVAGRRIRRLVRREDGPLPVGDDGCRTACTARSLSNSLTSPT